MNPDNNAANNWHLDKRINIAVITAIMLQIACFSIYMGKLDNRIQVLELDETKNYLLRDQFSRLDERMKSVDKGIDTLQSQMNFIIQNVQKKIGN